MALVTGYRRSNKWRGAVEQANGDTPFGVLIAETQATLVNRRRRNAAAEEWRQIHTDAESIYLLPAEELISALQRHRFFIPKS